MSESNQFPGILVLMGFWQSERYFARISQTIAGSIRSAFCISPNPASDTSVCVHVRRGDYVGNGHLALTPMSYFERAMAHMRSQLRSPHFTIFSDDPQWCREQFQHLGDVTVPNNSGRQKTSLPSFLKWRISAISSSPTARLAGGPHTWGRIRGKSSSRRSSGFFPRPGPHSTRVWTAGSGSNILRDLFSPVATELIKPHLKTFKELQPRISQMGADGKSLSYPRKSEQSAVKLSFIPAGAGYCEALRAISGRLQNNC